ncbi:MAG: type II secretion system protein GspL [Pseudomonadota bacterium]
MATPDLSTLIIALPADIVTPATSYRFLLQSDDAATLQHGDATVSGLPSASELVAVAPARSLSWHHVELPAGVAPGSPRMREVLDGLLEDRLLDEPSSLQFALAPDAQAGQSAWVAVCDRRWLAIAYQTLETEGRRVSRVVPEWSPGQVPDGLHVTGTLHEPYGVVCGADGVSVLPLAADARRWTLPEGIDARMRVTAEPELAGLAADRLNRQVEPLQDMARWPAVALLGWDLSKRLRMRKRARRSRAEWLQAPRWRGARWGVVVLLALNLLGLNALAARERAQTRAREAQVLQLLNRNFPQVKVIVDAPLQMQREVQRLERANATPAPGDLEALLTVAASALPPTRIPTTIDYGDGALRLGGVAFTAAETAALSQRLAPQRYSATTQSDTLVIRALPPDLAAVAGQSLPTTAPKAGGAR